VNLYIEVAMKIVFRNYVFLCA